MKEPVSIFWLRRDLRWHDNTGLFHALKGEFPVLPLFIFDRNILDDLDERDDARVTFIHRTLMEMNEEISDKGSSILMIHDSPVNAWKTVLKHYNVRAVYINRDYEPYARERDDMVEEILSEKDIPFHVFKDQVIFEQDEIIKEDGDPYVVFTPYSRKWLDSLENRHLDVNSSALRFDHFYTGEIPSPPTLESMGFQKSNIPVPSDNLTDHTLAEYAKSRDYPWQQATSRLGIHLRFGTVSIRKTVRQAREKSKTFLNELIWREFYSQILWHFPDVISNNFHKKYDSLEWRNNQHEFQRWCEGTTGFPIVDAGMRQLNETGYMHNRVRMIVASFLTKHLLIDWRWGEAYFAKKLLDYELASNNGGWQWAAGTGTDAQPYFRIFNPYSQAEKFDPDNKYIRKWVEEFGTDEYPDPIVEHKFARQRALDAYKKAVG